MENVGGFNMMNAFIKTAILLGNKGNTQHVIIHSTSERFRARLSDS